MKVVVSCVVFLGVLGLTGLASAREHDESPPAAQKNLQAEEAGLSCLCVQVCRITHQKGWPWSQRQPLPPGCAPLHDEVIYDNMANCSCPQPPATGDPTSPNH